MSYILNIESSTTNCSISLALNGKVIAIKEKNDESYSHSTKLHSFIDEVLKEKGITTCVHMGDVVDRRKFISFKIANDFRKRFINKFKELGIDLHIIIGNHDTYYKNTND